MRTLLVSDIHANLPALQAVLRAVRRKRISRLISLGDVVGYGASPNQVLALLRRQRRTKVFLRGNHDRVATGNSDPDDFNNAAKKAILWSREKLSREALGTLRDFTTGPFELEDGTLLCHGSPDDEDEYLLNEMQAVRIFSTHPNRLIFFGHTHLPSVFAIHPSGKVTGELVDGGTTLNLDPAVRYLINPGSVGQPRDRDSRAAFAIWDSARGTVRFLRTAYDVSESIHAICEAGLPEILGRRLKTGF